MNIQECIDLGIDKVKQATFDVGNYLLLPKEGDKVHIYNEEKLFTEGWFTLDQLEDWDGMGNAWIQY